MERVIRLLKQKNVVHIYPEGTRTRSGEIGKGKIGVGRIIRETGVKVIPCYHEGLDQVLPIGTKIPKTGKRIHIIIGEALHFDRYLSLPNTPKTWQMISDDIIEAIKGLKNRLGGVAPQISPTLTASSSPRIPSAGSTIPDPADQS
jgi:1-acyl-sn-glycerol-3-phosphate acyltransferase